MLYWASPRSFSNNPVNFVDPDGRLWYYNSDTGEAYKKGKLTEVKI
jgi:hypothetical protein